eukprot:scaffold49182_cov35-Tisochrysis_lutea.AAC.1
MNNLKLFNVMCNLLAAHAALEPLLSIFSRVPLFRSLTTHPARASRAARFRRFGRVPPGGLRFGPVATASPSALGVLVLYSPKTTKKLFNILASRSAPELNFVATPLPFSLPHYPPCGISPCALLRGSGYWYWGGAGLGGVHLSPASVLALFLLCAAG